MAAAPKLSSATEMARAAKPGSAEMTASPAEMSTTETRTAAVESSSATEMRAATAATHMNAAAMSSAAARPRIGIEGEGRHEDRRYDCDFEKISHGFTPRVKTIMCKHINVESS